MSNVVVKLAERALGAGFGDRDQRGVQPRRIPLDMRQLRYFIAVVDAGSFSRAAEQVHIAQPALSQHVLSMESILGVTLLRRNARGVVPTEAGLRLLDRAREIEHQFASLSGHVRGDVEPNGHVRIGLPAGISDLVGIAFIEACRERYPGIRVRLSEATSGVVAGWVKEGAVDLALTTGVLEEKRVKLHPLLSEEIVLFGRVADEAWPQDQAVTFAAALDLPLILPGPMHGLRETIEATAKSGGRRASPAIEVDSYSQIKQLVASGAGYGLLPATAVGEGVASGAFRSWRLSKPAPVQRVCLGHRSDLRLSTANRAVARLMWSVVEEMVRCRHWIAEMDSAGLPEFYE